ncbi:MAG: glycosyltransferase, partial [Candidatus Pacearchaeota archaeon]
PFGGVHVEAMLSGTPVITTDFGVFSQTVINGFNGFRCNTLDDFVQACKKVGELNPKEIRKHSEKYLMQNVALEFDKWFTDLYRLYQSTKDPTKKGWHYISK